ncbi:MAG: haloacid dehalogenase-like hydrolase [Blautia massiliensis (ex Durand et al. 2017)]
MSAKRLLDCTARELSAYGKRELLESIAGSEGRVLACETIGITQPLLSDVTNAEYAASLSADILLLNMFDVCHPVIQALPKAPEEETVRELKRLTGRVIGINLEPVQPELAKNNEGTLWQMSAGRLATAENARRAADMGVDLIVLTGNPGNGVSNEAIVHALREISAAVGDRVILAAGKMHASGVAGEGGENIMTTADAQAFMEAGADVILLPAPGTVPGITPEYAHRLIETIHAQGKLALTSIGTSQEGADVATIRQIALLCKMAGADIHHIGDTGIPGMALPQNILAYSIAIRGERHTYHRMAQSINR